MENLIELTDDLFDICWRLKTVNPDYFAVYNVTKKRFEVHNKSHSKQSLAFVVPFDELDCRTIEYAEQTRAENVDRLLAELNRQNERTEKNNVKNCASDAAESICRAVEG